MNIAIINAEAGGNKGAEAMLEILILKLSESKKDITLFLEISSKESYYVDVFLKRFPQIKIVLLRFSPKNIFNPYDQDLKLIDIAIDIGGINFHDNISLKGNIRNCLRFGSFLLNKTKLIFFTQDTGPVKKPINKFIAKYILSKSIAIFSRSLISYTELSENIKIDKRKIFGPYPDSTLAFKANDEIPKEIRVKDNYIVLCPSSIMFHKYGDNYNNLFVDLYNKYKGDYEILILVHNFTDNFDSSDSKVSALIKKSCPGAILINNNISAGQLKVLLKKASFAVTSRYHVLVGSVSQNIPSIALGWNPKYLSFLKLYDKQSWNVEFNEKSFEIITNQISEMDIDSEMKSLSSSNVSLIGQCNESFEKLLMLIDQI